MPSGWRHTGGMKKVTLRLPDWLHSKLIHAASQERRSMHGQIVYLLTRALSQSNNNEGANHGQ
jgi:hypothetical protein